MSNPKLGQKFKLPGRVLKFGAGIGESVGAPPGATNFLALTDTPDDYSGHAYQIPYINSTEENLEFTGTGLYFNPALGLYTGMRIDMRNSGGTTIFMRDTAAGADDFAFSSGSSIFWLRNVDDNVEYISVNGSHDMVLGAVGSGANPKLSLCMDCIPAADPHVAGQLYRTGNDLMISTG